MKKANAQRVALLDDLLATVKEALVDTAERQLFRHTPPEVSGSMVLLDFEGAGPLRGKGPQEQSQRIDRYEKMFWKDLSHLRDRLRLSVNRTVAGWWTVKVTLL